MKSQPQINIFNELSVDNFAGGAGAVTELGWPLGASDSAGYKLLGILSRYHV